MTTTEFDLAQARTYIAQVYWRFAKTMPQWPHEYTVRNWRPDLEAEFFAFVELIRRESSSPGHRMLNTPGIVTATYRSMAGSTGRWARRCTRPLSSTGLPWDRQGPRKA